MPRVRTRAPRRAAALLVASAAVLVTAACGGSSDSSTGDTGNQNGAGGGNAGFAAYVACMKTNGVTITMPSGGPQMGGGNGASRGPGGFPSGQPRPSGSAGARGNGFPGGGNLFSKPEGVDEATWTKAEAACASVKPSGRAGRGNGGGGADAAFRNCLKQHGVTSTEPNLATSDPTVAKALETCKVLQPAASATPTA